MERRRQIKSDIIIYLIIFIGLTVPFLLFDLDIYFQRLFYNPEDGFYLRSNPFWNFIYVYGIYPGYLFVIGSLVVFCYSYWKSSLIKWRKPVLFLLFTIILGPGLLVNATFKDHWGRPRPGEIIEFGGKEEYVKPWVMTDGSGKSFPCGHASMGFFLSIPFLIYRNKNQLLAWIFMITGTLYGLLVGIARMLAGGHFASDVLWSAGMVWFAALLIFYLIKADKEPKIKPLNSQRQKKQARKVTIMMGIVFPLLIASALVATPYVSKKTFERNISHLSGINMKQLTASFNEGAIDVAFNDGFKVNYEVTGFGFPNSKIRSRWIEGDSTAYWLDRMGWFTEVKNKVRVEFPTVTPWEQSLLVNEGDVYIHIDSNYFNTSLNISVLKGDVTLLVDSDVSLNLTSNTSNILNPNGFSNFAEVDTVLCLNIQLDNGSVKIEAE